MLHIPIFETHLVKVFIKLVLDYQILLVLLILVMSYMFTLHIENVRLNLINHLVGFIPCQFACNLTISNPAFRWESCKGNV